MPWNGNYVDDAAAEIDAASVFRPMRDSEELLRSFHGQGHKRGMGTRSKLGISGGMVVMRMRVPDNECRDIALSLHGPLLEQFGHRASHVRLSGTGIDQERFFLAEQQIEERLLVIHASVFAENVEIGIIRVDLPLRRVPASGTSGMPAPRESSGANATAVRSR